MAKVLSAKEVFIVALVSITDTKLETQEYGVFEMKRMFLFSDKATLNAADSTRVPELSVKDSVFVKFVQEKTPGMDGKTVHEQCVRAVGQEACSAAVEQFEDARSKSALAIVLES